MSAEMSYDDYRATPKALAQAHEDQATANRLMDMARRTFPDSFPEASMPPSTPPAANAAKTHCPRGHELIEGNLVPSAPSRSCLTCSREQSNENSAARRSAHKALGITQAAYVARYGWSRATAEAVLAGVS